jgi:hypothetical protein
MATASPPSIHRSSGAVASVAEFEVDHRLVYTAAPSDARCRRSMSSDPGNEKPAGLKPAGFSWRSDERGG